MPEIVNRLVGHLKKKGYDKGAALAIANSTLQRAGEMKNGKLTAKGKKQNALGPAGRAKARKAKR